MRIYFYGVGGVGIGPLALLAHDAGYEVYGSDREESLMTNELHARSIPYSLDQSGETLKREHSHKSFNWFVHTAALPEDHPELVVARTLGLHIAKRDELLAHIVKEKGLRLVAVAGTHGKTTATGMLVWLAQKCKSPISYSVGSGLSFGPSGCFDPLSRYFIYECDEFDRNFLHFFPHYSIITSYDYDHPDTYPTPIDYREAFSQFISQSHCTALYEKDARAIQTVKNDGNVDIVSWDDPRIQLCKLPGAHNRRNALLAVIAAHKTFASHISHRELLRMVNEFPGTTRRFEKLADGLYSDYGHHPTEIAATLQLARELNSDITLVYQPHQNIRQHEIKDQYRDQFELAQQVFWLPTYLSREKHDLSILQPEELTSNITNRSAIQIAQLDDRLWQQITAARKRGSLVLCMGAGSIDSWLREQLAAQDI